MLVFGTRPEAIKMCPLVNVLKKNNELQTVVCVTGQHRQMLDMMTTIKVRHPKQDSLTFVRYCFFILYPNISEHWVL